MVKECLSCGNIISCIFAYVPPMDVPVRISCRSRVERIFSRLCTGFAYSFLLSCWLTTNHRLCILLKHRNAPGELRAGRSWKSFLCIFFFFTPEAKIALNKMRKLRKASPYRKGKDFPWILNLGMSRNFRFISFKYLGLSSLMNFRVESSLRQNTKTWAL